MLKSLKKNKVFKFLASLKLAVILLVALAVILATATFYESLYDTKTAQYLVYRSPLFALFLVVLGINLTCSALVRYPWKRSQTGFVITHMGIIIILVGSLATMYGGVDGSSALEEGQSTERVMIDEPVIYFGRELESLREIPAEYRWSPPKPGKSEYRYELGGENENLTAVIDDYYHHAKSETLYVPHDSGIPALKLRLFNDKVDQNLWLTPATGQVDLGPAKVSFERLPDEKAVKKFTAGQRSEERGTVQILVDDRPQVLNLDSLEPGVPFPLEFPGVKVELLRYIPHAVVVDGELVSKSDVPHNPSVELRVTKGESQQTWLLFAKMSELSSPISSTGEKLNLRMLYNREQKKSRSFQVALKPDGSLLYRVDGGEAKPFTPESSVNTGWMDLKAQSLSYIPVARQTKLFQEVFPKKGKEDKAPGPAIRMKLDNGKSTEPMWLERGDIKKVSDPDGQFVYIGYGYKTVKLPFSIALKDFRIGYDPGTQTAATYESDVEVKGQSFTIAMNEPYEGEGYKVFQASFSKTPDGRDVSVFSIANDPGIELKYIGSIMLVLGIIIMFYFKPKKKAVQGGSSNA